MCWCARVYWTVLQNLFARFYNSLAERNCVACCGQQRCYCCCGGYRRQASDVDGDCDADSDSIKRVSVSNANEDQQQRPQHDYVIVGEFCLYTIQQGWVGIMWNMTEKYCIWDKVNS